MFILIIGIACEKNEIDKPEPYEPYIKSRLIPDTTDYYNGFYYIHIIFNKENESGMEELRLTRENQYWTDPSDGGGMTSQRVLFRDPESNDVLYIDAKYNLTQDTAFRITYADYYFSDIQTKVAGLNINYKPMHNPSEHLYYYYYLGRNSHECYFKITYIGNNRINGTFSTRMEEHGNESKVYNATGDFSIPYSKYFY